MNKIKLGDVLEVKRGVSLSGEFYSDKGNCIRLTLGNFNYPGGGFKKNTAKTDIYFTGKVKAEAVLKTGDIITPLTEQVAGLLGETARIPDDGTYIQSGDIGLIIPNEDVLDKSFAYYLISSPIIKKQLGAGAQQTKIRHTSPDKIKDCVAYLPDITQQRHIGSILDTINSKIELNNKINTELEAMAKLIYDYWFVQFDFPDENGRPYKSSGGKMVWSDELKREIPQGWKVGGLDDIGDIVGGSTPSRSNGDLFTENGISWITPKDLSLNSEKKFISRGETDVTQQGVKNASLKLMPKGTVLLSSRAPIGYIAIARNEVTTNQGFKSLVPKESFSTEYIYHTVQLYVEAMTQYASGSTFSEISASTLKMIKIAIPNIELVKSYTETVLDLFAQQDILEQENEQLEKLRDWLLPMLMNGQVKVSE